MTELKAGKIYSKEFDGKNGKWKKYSTKVGERWYTLKGSDAKNIKEGDTIMGEVEQREWEANGKSGTEYTLVLIDPIVAGLVKRIETLENKVRSLQAPHNAEPDKDIEVENNDDLPF